MSHAKGRTDMTKLIVAFRNFAKAPNMSQSCKEVNSFSNNVFSTNRAVCEINRKCTVEPVSSQMKMWRLRIAGWTSKATNMHSQ